MNTNNIFADHYLQVFQIAQLTGEIMLKNGAETYRVEDTISRILGTTGFAQIEAFTTLTGITISMGDPSITPIASVKRVQSRSNHLRKVEMANDLSRRFVSGKIDIEGALAELNRIDQDPLAYPRYVVDARLRYGLRVFLSDFWRKSPGLSATVLVGTLYGVLPS